MGFEESSQFCTGCNRQTLARRKTPSHVLHLLLTIFTAGLWLPVWILCCVRIGSGWRCATCGRITKGASSGSGLLAAAAVIVIIVMLIVVGHHIAAASLPQ
jgi:hypothetical protein